MNIFFSLEKKPKTAINTSSVTNVILKPASQNVKFTQDYSIPQKFLFLWFRKTTSLCHSHLKKK